MIEAAAMKRTLGPWRCWALVVGGTIGSAIYMMPAMMVPYGGLGLLSLLAATVGAMAVGLMFANLSRHVTTTGGPYAYARAGFGDFGGFLIAWCYWISQWTAAAALVIGFTSYAGALFPAIGASPVLSLFTSLTLTWAFVAVNIAGVRESGIVGLVTTIMKVVPLLLIGTIGLLFVDVHHMPPARTAPGSPVFVFATVFALTFWNFVGIESATVPAEDVLEPEKTIPSAVITGTLTVALVNLLVAVAVMGMIPPAQLAASASPLADAGRRMGGEWAGLIVSLSALVSAAGTLNMSILCAGQTAMAAARDGIFPSMFRRLGARHTPVASYFIVGVLTSALVIMGQTRGLVEGYKFVILIATLTAVIPYAFSALAALVLDGRGAPLASGKRFREALTAGIAFIACLWVIAAGGEESVYWVFILLMVGMPMYVAVRRARPG
jgi:basic amino acid/polyamine antiporter, APA family